MVRIDTGKLKLRRGFALYNKHHTCSMVNRKDAVVIRLSQVLHVLMIGA